MSLDYIASRLDRFANADIRSAAADVAEHGFLDVGVGRMRVACDEGRGRHDLARLAIAALHYLAVEPSFLDLGARRSRADRFDCRDLGIADAVDGCDAGTRGSTVDMHRASTAQCHAATEFGAGQAQHGRATPRGGGCRRRHRRCVCRR